MIYDFKIISFVIMELCITYILQGDSHIKVEKLGGTFLKHHEDTGNFKHNV